MLDVGEEPPVVEAVEQPLDEAPLKLGQHGGNLVPGGAGAGVNHSFATS
jgi:hypothetical protein